MAIKNIIFDMGGVIIDFRPENTLKKYFENDEDINLVLSHVFHDKMWQDMDRGIRTVSETIEIACSRLPAHMHCTIRNMLENWFDEMPPKEDVYSLVKELHENGYKIYLLSNAPKSFYDNKDNIPAFALFDGFVISADHHMLKPEASLYNVLFDEFCLNPSECFFIDDIQKNIDGAIAVGMDGHCFFDYDVGKLRSAMQLKGIKIN